MTIRFIQAKGNAAAEIWLYEQVGDSFWGDGVSAKSFQKELTALGKVDKINLHINSPGGDVFDGFTIYNLLAQHPARVVVDIDGLAASIASIIAMAGDEIRIASNAMMMIHNPHGMAMGDDREMQRVAGLLQQIKVSLVDTYAARTNQPANKLEAWMDEETWMTADTAVQQGFADVVSAEQRVSACFNLLKDFRNVPAPLRQQRVDNTTPQRDIAAVRIAQQAERLRARS